jgi:hypothetical protein
MEARLVSVALATAALLACGAGARSQNFIVQAPTQQLAQEICTAAENYRRDLAIEWLGKELPPWQQPCPIQAKVHPQLGAGGATSFMFNPNGEPFGWTMEIQGSRERVLDSVLPHEVTHTIFATHFGRPLPRWADEGACTTVEHPDEKKKQERYLIEFLMTDRGIAFNKMFAMKEYPPDILPLYSQGYSLARYFIQQGGKRKYVEYIGEGMRTNNWPAATRKYYGFKDLSELQTTWVEWVRAGSPDLDGPVIASNTQDATDVAVNDPAVMLASNTVPVSTPEARTSDAKVLGSQSMGHSYVRPERPSHFTQPAGNDGAEPRASSVARPTANGSYYSKEKQPAGARGAAPVNLLPAAHPQPSREQPAQDKSAQAEPPLPPANWLASNLPEAQPAAPLAGAGRKVLLEWSRPADKPWSPEAMSIAAAPTVSNAAAEAAQQEQPWATPISALTARPATYTPEEAAAGTVWR